jgi:ABC-type polysaccharide/polyol phosphate transport system ATPase subunit
MDVAIEATDVWVRFLFDRQARPVTPGLARIRRNCTEGWGVQGIDFRAGAGEGVALIGANGAGKTTLLRVLAGVMPADVGHVSVRGRIGSLLSIEAGLMPTLTGRENTMLLGVLAGLSRAESRAALPHVEARSELGRGFERPVSSYSQGMRARLGFAVMELANPEILLLDEVHEALDHEFREFVGRRARAILDAGGIVVAAGHDHGVLKELCPRGVLLDGGRVEADGPFSDVLERYLARESARAAEAR